MRYCFSPQFELNNGQVATRFKPIWPKLGPQVAERIGWIREAAGERFSHVEININLMAVGAQVPRYLQMSLGAAASQLAESDAIPVLKGTTDQMGNRIEWLREKFGITYIMVGEELMEARVPIVSRLAGK